MTVLSTRLIVVAESQPDPLAADNPNLLFIHDRVGVSIEPISVKNAPAPLDSEPDFYDMLVGPRFDKTGYSVVYEAELQADSRIMVNSDLFGPGDYPYTWSGWPLPGDQSLPPEVEPDPTKLTEKQQEALDHIQRKRKGGEVKGEATKTLHVRGKVSNWVDDAPTKKSGKK